MIMPVGVAEREYGGIAVKLWLLEADDFET